MYDRFPKVSPNGLTAGLFLAFLATAGLFYVNIMPAIVNGLIEGLGFTNQQAGYVASANTYGAAFGALLIVWLVKRLNWQLAATIFLIGLLTVDLSSLLITQPGTLIAVRFVHGFIGGMLIGTAFSVMARTAKPDRSFGLLLFVQFGLGGLGVMFIPGLVPEFGSNVLFYALLAFSTVTFLMLPFLPAYEVDPANVGKLTSRDAPIAIVPLSLTLGAIFLFQAANMGLYAYIIGLGQAYSLEMGFITTTLGVAAWLGLLGAGLVVVVADRWGYLLPLSLGIGLTAVATFGYLYSDIHWVWIAANYVIGITWGWCMSYLLGLMSRYDDSGQMAALGGFASKMGLASGPAIAGLLIGDNNYATAVWAAALTIIVASLAIISPARQQDALK